MATIAELLGDKAQEVREKAGAPTTLHTPEVCLEAMRYMAAGLPGAAYTRDPQGRVRSHGKFVAKPKRVTS